MIATTDERQAELRKSFERGIKLMKTHIDRNIDDVLKSVQEDRKKDKMQQVGFYDNLIFQNQMSANTVGDYKASFHRMLSD